MKILLFGTGKTGTTALTYAIKEKLSNHKIIFEPSSLSDIDYFSQKNLIVKSLKIMDWQKEQEYFKNFDRKILIVRDPLDRLVSSFLYIPYDGNGFSNDYLASKYIELLKKKTDQPDSVSVLSIVKLLNKITGIKLIKQSVSRYEQILMLSRQKNHDFFLMRYEDFIDQNTQTMAKYLGIKLSQEVVVDSKYKRVSRTKKHSDWKNWFTLNDLNSVSKKFGDFNTEFNYSYTQKKNYLPKINRENSYQYTINVINEYRRKNLLPEFEENKINIGQEGTFIDKAIAQLRKNNFSDAELAINKAIEINPSLPSVYLLQGRILSQQNRFQEAVLAVSNVIKNYPNYSNAYEQLRRILQRQKKIG